MQELAMEIPELSFFFLSISSVPRVCIAFALTKTRRKSEINNEMELSRVASHSICKNTPIMETTLGEWALNKKMILLLWPREQLGLMDDPSVLAKKKKKEKKGKKKKIAITQ